MSQRPTAAGVRMQFARTRCMVTIPKVSPFHRRKISGVLFLVSPTHSNPACMCMLLRWLSNTREGGASSTRPRDQAKDEVILASDTWHPWKGCHCHGARASLRPRDCSCLGFLLRITAPKTTSLAPADRLKALAGPHRIGSDQAGCLLFVVCIPLSVALLALRAAVKQLNCAVMLLMTPFCRPGQLPVSHTRPCGWVANDLRSGTTPSSI
jgi:hypothetical protein